MTLALISNISLQITRRKQYGGVTRGLLSRSFSLVQIYKKPSKEDRCYADSLAMAITGHGNNQLLASSFNPCVCVAGKGEQYFPPARIRSARRGSGFGRRYEGTET